MNILKLIRRAQKQGKTIILRRCDLRICRKNCTGHKKGYTAFSIDNKYYIFRCYGGYIKID